MMPGGVLIMAGEDDAASTVVPRLIAHGADLRRVFFLDEVSADTLVGAGFSADASDRARSTTDSFRKFIEEHRDEITALEVLYSRPQSQRVTYEQISELAKTIGRPPYQWTPEKLWHAYETLDRSRVYGSGQRILTEC